MRQIPTIVLLLFPIFALGQKKDRLSIIFHLQPELTFYKNNYAYRWRDTYTKSTFNMGIGVLIQYNVADKFFVEGGGSYISRQLKTTVFLNQSALPPPRQSFTQELVNTKSVSFRTAQVPINFGYRFMSKEKKSLFLTTGLTGNFLFNTYYELGGFLKYQGAYKKNYWQGFTVSLGVGTDYKIFRNITATARITYSLINTSKADEYLFSQDQYFIPLPHKFLQLTFGMNIPL